MSLTSLLLIRELRPLATRTASPYINKNGKMTKKKKKKKLKQAVWVNCLQKLNFRLWSLVLSHCKLRREQEKKSRTGTLKSKDKSDFRFSDISEGQTDLLLPKYRETSSRFCYCSFVCIRVLGKTAGFGFRHYLLKSTVQFL